jgi:hypothetical protein
MYVKGGKAERWKGEKGDVCAKRIRREGRERRRKEMCERWEGREGKEKKGNV